MSRRGRTLNDTLNTTTTVESDAITLSGLLNIKWNMYRTSFYLEKEKNERYATIRSKISEINILIATRLNNTALSVAITSCPAIAASSNSTPALMVEVISNEKQIYIGYFINWSPSPEPIENLAPLPLLLVKGKADITQKVHGALIEVFDFVITPMKFNHLEMALMFAIFVCYAEREEKGSAQLKYTVPGVAASSAITTSTCVKDLTNIFDFFNDSKLEENEKIERIFYEKLLNHFRRVYQLDLSRADLKEVSLPKSVISSSGQVRITDEDILIPTLQGISNMFLDDAPQKPCSSFSNES